MTPLAARSRPRRVSRRRVVALRALSSSLSILGPAQLRAAPGENTLSTAKIVVDFDAADEARASIAAAWQQNLFNDLSGFARLEPIDKRDVDMRPCKQRQAVCVLARYGAAGIDIVVLGKLDRRSVHYEVHETWRAVAR